MENARKVCVSPFFFTSSPCERAELLNDDMDQELFEVCEQIEKENTSVCGSASLFNSLPRERVELFNDDMSQELFEVCGQIENWELLFDSSYDDELYNHCAIIESKLIQSQQVGRGMKRGIKTDGNIIFKKTRSDEGASTSSAGTNNVDNNKVVCDTCHALINKRYLTNR